MKKSNKKVLLISIVSFVLICITFVFAPKVSTSADNNKKAYIEGTDIEIPAPKYKANKDKPKDALLSKDAILEIAKNNQAKVKGASLKDMKLVTYKEHKLKDNPDCTNEVNYIVDDDRMVWVQVTEFSDGLDTRVGHYSNATVTTVFDAETGDYLESRVHGNLDGQGV